ncbi:MAG: response regulator [Terriglobia bacterium]
MPARRQSSPAQPQRVLAVDPDAAFLTAVKRVVESGRCRVDCAATAAEALDFLARHDYHLVIADLRIAELDARHLYDHLADRIRDGLQLLFLAAEPPAGELQEFLEEHRFACLPKPLHLRRFLDKLEDMLFLPLQPPED